MHLKLNKHLSNQEIGQIFDFVGQVLALKPNNQYRSAAYENAAATIKTLSIELKDFYQKKEHDFDELPSIGESLDQKLEELFKTGDIKALQKYVAKIPEVIYELQLISGIGVKTALELNKKFNLENKGKPKEHLLQLARDGQIKNLPGWGEKSEVQLIKQLEQNLHKERLPYKKAHVLATKLVKELAACSQIKKIKPMGSLRRHSPTVGDIDLGIITPNLTAVKKCLKQINLVKNISIAGEAVLRLQLKNGEQVDLRTSNEAEWGSFLQHFTGSKEHNIKLRELALKQGLSLSEHGVKIKRTDKLKKFKSEKEFYKFLGFKLIPPQERLGGGEFEKYKL